MRSGAKKHAKKWGVLQTLCEMVKIHQVEIAIWHQEPCILDASIVQIHIVQREVQPLLLSLQLWRVHLRDAEEGDWHQVHLCNSEVSNCTYHVTDPW